MLILKRIALVVSLFLSIATHALTIDEIDSYGIYVKGKNGFVAAAPLSNDSLRYDFSSKLLALPNAAIDSGPIEVVLFNKGLTIAPGAIEAEVRSVSTPAAGVALTAESITPAGEDKYLLTFAKGVNAKNTFLVFDTYCCTRHVFAIALSDPRQSVLEVFSKSAQHNPISVEFVLSKIMSGAPDDKGIKELHAYWAGEIAKQKASAHFAQITGAWDRYEESSDVDTRIKALKHVRSLSNDYLEKHPRGSDVREVNRLLNTASNKLDI